MTVPSTAGSQFAKRDVDQAGSAADTITLKRTITVDAAVAPGVWHKFDPWALDTAFGKFGGATKSYLNSFWRETRSGMPPVATHDPNTGDTLTLAHTSPGRRA